jgi:hypothetical protein
MYKYTTFEEEAERKKIRGRVLTVLEFDKIKEKLLEWNLNLGMTDYSHLKNSVNLTKPAQKEESNEK